jgi:hypothetical protein
LSCLHKCIPFDLGEKRLNETGVEFRFPDFELDILEDEGEIVGVAILCMAGKEIVGYEPDHLCCRKEVCPSGGISRSVT